MRSLYLLRHAKSSWKNEGLADFDRPLAGRGRKASEVIGKYLKDNDVKFDLVVSSPAVRARETIDQVLRTARMRSDLRYDERIYEATSLALLQVVSQLENDRKAVALVGHNPGMEELLALLTGKNERFPTATLAKIVFKNSKWTEVPSRKGLLEWIIRPRELET